MTPDYERAAIKATETLIKHNIGTAPIYLIQMFDRESENVYSSQKE